jgi:methylmalonyl-CoA/ethylmalonyl-CoA epimerase
MLELHHIGNLVDDIDTVVATYKLLFGKECASNKTFVSTQGVYVCFIDIGKNVFLELIQPIDETSLVYKMRKKGISYYHLAYRTNDFDSANEYLLTCNFRTLNLFYSEAFANKRCQFMFSPEGNLIELIEY